MCVELHYHKSGVTEFTCACSATWRLKFAVGQSKVTLWNIYIHTHMHTYIHKWTCCMAFKLWNTVELIIGPRPLLLFRGIPLNFEFKIFVEQNVRCTQNLRITAGNHIPYFEALKKMQGLFKSPENRILACLLHLQLHAPLFRFQKHLHLTWF